MTPEQAMVTEETFVWNFRAAKFGWLIPNRSAPGIPVTIVEVRYIDPRYGTAMVDSSFLEFACHHGMDIVGAELGVAAICNSCDRQLSCLARSGGQ